ncbi:MAG: tetratricopeptide repeat protein [SAR202 cluster bacterium]|nr:tetratricopeptide repeat protein [SAR202 cluster bacterium]
MTDPKYRQWHDGEAGVPERVPTDAELDAWPAPDTAQGFFKRGLRLAQLGFPERAAKDFEEAVQLDPDNPEIQYNLGTACLSLGLFEQALRNFDRAIALKPGVADAHGNRAIAFAALGEDLQMRQDLDLAVKLGADRARLEAIAGYVRARRKTGHGLLNPGDDAQHDHGHDLPHPRWGGFPRNPQTR